MIKNQENKNKRRSKSRHKGVGTTIQNGLLRTSLWSENIQEFAREKCRSCTASQKRKRGIHKMHGETYISCYCVFIYDRPFDPFAQVCFILFFEFLHFPKIELRLWTFVVAVQNLKKCAILPHGTVLLRKSMTLFKLSFAVVRSVVLFNFFKSYLSATSTDVTQKNLQILFWS